MISVKNTYRAGDTVTIALYRAGETLTVQLTFDEQTEQQSAQTQPQTPAGDDGYGFGGDGFDNGDGFDDGFGFDPWSWFFGN